MSLAINNLILEITRKCNMRCPHCLRGPVQSLDMSNAVIDRVTTAADHVFCLSVTGGEPSLNGKAINHLRWSAHFNKCLFDYFWLTVNARFFKQDFYEALLELYSVCGDRECCCLTVSGDQYHGKRSNRAMEMYAELPFYSNTYMRLIDDERLLDDGMARINGIGRREKENIQTEITNYDLVGESLYIGDMVYINAKGDVLLDCDLSYASQRKHTIGNVLTEPLEQILRRRLKPQAA